MPLAPRPLSVITLILNTLYAFIFVGVLYFFLIQLWHIDVGLPRMCVEKTTDGKQALGFCSTEHL